MALAALDDAAFGAYLREVSDAQERAQKAVLRARSVHMRRIGAGSPATRTDLRDLGHATEKRGRRT